MNTKKALSGLGTTGSLILFLIVMGISLFIIAPKLYAGVKLILPESWLAEEKKAEENPKPEISNPETQKYKEIVDKFLDMDKIIQNRPKPDQKKSPCIVGSFINPELPEGFKLIIQGDKIILIDNLGKQADLEKNTISKRDFLFYDNPEDLTKPNTLISEPKIVFYSGEISVYDKNNKLIAKTPSKTVYLFGQEQQGELNVAYYDGSLYWTFDYIKPSPQKTQCYGTL